MARSYVALVADAMGSRQLPTPRRAGLQRDVRAAVTELNRRWRGRRAARFAVTLGDEVQGLLPDATAVWEISHGIRARFPATDWVVAWGRGPLTTPPPPGAAAPELDGPCFHRAREALDRAKRARQVLAFGGFDPDLSHLAAYYSALYWSWTERQRQAAALLRLGGPAETAAALGVSRSAVSHLARRMAWPLVEAGDSLVRALLERA